MTATNPPQNAADDLLARVFAWLAQDPDPQTRDELKALVAAFQAGSTDAEAALRSRFDRRLGFGTAGLRGEIAAGPNRMNRVLVAQAAAGIAEFLLARADGNADPSVVIGYDGRRNSTVFATDSAEIFAGAGVRTILLPRLLPTPVLAFAVRHLGTSAGVMVTASHNPPNDNGYKVYLGGEDRGSQIVSPVDAEIAARIEEVAATTSVQDLRRGTYDVAPESVIEAYIAATAAIVPAPRTQPRVVYTPMHGVGWETMQSVLTAAGFDEPALVEAQVAPDPTFPTVTFPNPEEPGAMDLAYARASEVGADLIIANDPDADRVAIAIPAPRSEHGYRRLSGNEVGVLLGWRAARAAHGASMPRSDESDGASPDAEAPRGTLACSLVSSPALGSVAREYGLDFVETLTGFKWISRAPNLVFGYEEALGYLVNPDDLGDKDGISAALAFLSLTAELQADGRTIADHLDEFIERFGYFASAQISLRVTDITQIDATMHRLRSDPPAMIGSIPVDEIDDLATGTGSFPPSDVLRIRLSGGARVMVRPSGTEPKLKIYIDAHSNIGTVAERRARADATIAELERGMRELID